MFKRLRSRLLDRLADALAHRIAVRIEKEIAVRLRERSISAVEADRIGLRKGVPEERIALIRSVFPPKAYPSRREYRERTVAD